MPVIDRVLSEELLQGVKDDFKNLIKIVNRSYGELELAIREDYLNLYYKGNNAARISRKASGDYLVTINEKFFAGTKADDPAFFVRKTTSRGYAFLTLDEYKPPSRFLQKAHINMICSRIREENYGEEIEFEQALITDNLGREDLIIIDRQISDHVRRKQLDLLVLKQVGPNQNHYHFLVLEVKLGKNPELKKEVAGQLSGYQEHIQRYINDYIRCYQKQFEQKKALGIIRDIPYDKIEIEREVSSLVVVGGYSKMADASISELKEKFPEIEVKRFSYLL